MRFSIAIPVMGQAEFLPVALASLRAQAAEVELAVMDATPGAVIQDILDRDPQGFAYRRHGPDAGQAAAINEGWTKTSGDVVGWLCADDYYFPDALARVERYFEEHDDVDVAYGDSVFVDRSGNFTGYFPAISDDISEILHGCCISQPACFVRRRALDRIGTLDPELHYVMDWNLWTRLYVAGARFGYLPEPLAAVRNYPDTKTASRSRERFAEINRQLAAHTGFFRRMKSLVGFYHYDLRSEPGRNSSMERVLLGALGAARALKRAVGWPAPRSHGPLYGIERHTNKVIGECEVNLPVYGAAASIDLDVQCEGAAALDVSINGAAIPAVALASAHPCRTFRATGVPFPRANRLRVTLASRPHASWQLLKVAVSAA